MRYLTVGYIAGVFSFRGYIKLKPTADDLLMIANLKRVVLHRFERGGGLLNSAQSVKLGGAIKPKVGLPAKLDYADNFKGMVNKAGGADEGYVEYIIEDIKLRPTGIFIIKFAGVDDEVVAKSLQSCSVLIPADDMPEVDDGYAYWYQLEGASVYNIAGAKLGVLSDCIEGATDIFEIKFDDGRVAFISNNKDHIRSIDVDGKKVIIDEIGLVFNE